MVCRSTGRRTWRSASSAFFFCRPPSDTFAYGGQAVIEGVMMRGPDAFAVAVRRADGSIAVNRQPLPSWAVRRGPAGWPLVRGVLALLESLVLGVQVLTYSAEVAADEEGETLGREEIALALLLAVGLAVGLFVVIPAFLGHWSATRMGPWGQNLLEGVLRLVIFLGYLGGISRLAEVRTLFAYHGAEHKVIHAWESGAGLDPAAAGSFPRLHPRCGTSFVLLVMLLAVLLYSVVPVSGLGSRIAVRVGLMPALAGISYEVLRWSARAKNRWPVRLLIAPGLGLQKMTTREPDRDQLQVAAVALEAVLAKQGESAGEEVSRSVG
ncbi:MAG: DUF1385 domain-containing protein [Clostridia bacterium]|nr:DUF1385 domain-containing protein [Clostridia bacterium]